MASTLVRRLLLQIQADAGDAETKLELISKQADELKAKHPELKVKLDTAEAQAKMAVLREEFKKAVKVKVEPDVSGFRSLIGSLKGLSSAKGGWKQLLGMFGGGGGSGGSGAAAAGAEGASGLMDFLLSPEGLLTAAGLSFPAAALATTALGAGVGGLGAFGAYKMGANAQTQVMAMQKQVASLQKTLSNVNSKGRLSVTGATRAQDEARLAAEQAHLSAYQRQHAGVLGVYSDIQRTGAAVSQVFNQAITGGGKSSFASSLARDLSQVAGFVKTLGPDLQKMFQASEPYIKAVVTGLEGFAKTVIPAVTSALRAFAPHLPGIIRMFQYISDAVGAVIRAMGWMAKGFADLVNWVSQGLHKAIPAIGRFLARMQADLANAAQAVDNFVSRAVRDVENWAKDFARYIYTDPRKWIDAFVGDMEKLPGRILHAIGNMGKLLWNAGRSLIDGLIGGVKSALGGLGSFLGGIGSFIIHHKGPPAADAVLLRPAGRLMIDGLMAGVSDRMPQLQSRLRGVSTLAAASVTGGRQATAAAGYPALRLEITGGTAAFRTFLKQSLRVTGGDPSVVGL